MTERAAAPRLNLFDRQAGLVGDAQDLAAQAVVEAAHGRHVLGLGGTLDRLGEIAQRRRADHAGGTLQSMRRARDGGGVVARGDLARDVAGSVVELALDGGDRAGIVAEQLDQLVAVIGLHAARSTRASFNHVSSVARSSSIPTGLVTSPSMPTSRVRVSWSSSALAVMARIGV